MVFDPVTTVIVGIFGAYFILEDICKAIDAIRSRRDEKEDESINSNEEI